MSLWEHLQEFRKTLIRSLLGVVVCSVASYVFWKDIWRLLTWPMESKGLNVQIINTAPVEAFITSIKVALVSGIVVASPWVLFNFWRFIAPGLFDGEKRLLFPVMFFSILLFLGGASFCYFMVLPYGLQFLANYSGGEVAANWRQGDYATFVLRVLIAFGASFEMPVVSFVLTKLGLITAKSLISFSRYALVLIFIVSAFLTPPDPITQILLGIPLCLIYGVSILVSMAVSKNKDLEA